LITLSLRQAIIQRVHGKSQAELTEIIEGSIGNNEQTLPGLGVLFELIWQNLQLTDKNKLVNTLHAHLADAPAPLQAPQ
jgi:small acid-soluble spore protein I (minor)